MSKALGYEAFIRGAFETANRYHSQNQNISEVGRGEDPAGLAEAGLYNQPTLTAKEKVGTAYAMEIYSKTFKNAESTNVSEDAWLRMDSIIEDVLNADTHERLFELIEEYRDTIRAEYLPLLP